MFIGPPGSGKSSLIDRLLKRIRKRLRKSTGVCNSVIIVDISEINPSSFHAATALDSETWKEVDYEVSIVNQLGESSTEKSNKSEDEKLAPSADIQDDVQEPTPAKRTSTKESVPKPSREPQHKLVLVSSKKEPVAVIAMSSESVLSIIDRYGFETFKNYLQKTFSLYLRDTGGQVEFQEMLPLIIFGPSIFFFVFRTDLDFRSKFTIEYRKSESESLNCYTSSITTEEALLQCLASVYAIDTSVKGGVKMHKPLVFVVGTHTDQLGSSADTRIAELNQEIHSLIHKNGFQDIVQYADTHKNQVIFPVDNTSESDEDFKFIRSNVNSLIDGRKEFNIEYPVSYLLLCLDLQNEKKKVLTLDEFRALAARHGIEGDHVFQLLHFLHLRIGIVRYYDEEGLRDIVIIEPQILFNTITDLVIKTFSCKALTSSEMNEFEKKGLLTASMLESVINSDEMKKGILPASAFKNEIFSGEKISPEKFLLLLVHLRIITPFRTSSNQEEKYFIPCVLNHASKSSGEKQKTDILPLAVKFQCSHCPKGVFGVLVTHLMAPELDEDTALADTKFSLMQDKIFKDQVSFKVVSSGFHDEVSLTVYSSHLEINFFPDLFEDRDFPITEACCNVREIVEKSLLASLGSLHYSRDRVKPEMCLQCSDCPELHPVIKGKFHRIYCSKTQRSSRIPPKGRCWYGEEGKSVVVYILVSELATDLCPGK